MNSGKTIFAQLMDFIPAYEFRKVRVDTGNHLRILTFPAGINIYVLGLRPAAPIEKP